MPALSRRLGVMPFLIVVLATTLSACSTAGSSTPSVVAPSTVAATALTPSVTPVPTTVAAFPVTLTDDEGAKVDIATEPRKIVSITPATTEILFAIGVGDRVVATDDGSDYPDAAVPLPDVATFNKVDVEKVVALEPDLVIAGGLGFSPAESITRLRSLKIPVIVVYAASVDGVYHDIELLGAATGVTSAAAAVTASMRSDIEAVSGVASGQGSKPRVYYEVGYDDVTGAIFAPADDSFVAQMVTLAGADAITTGDPATYEIPLEKLIERDPQIIILGTNPFYSPTPASVKARAGWGAMTAVKNGDVRPVRDIEITRPGPRLPIGLRNLATGIWPGIALPAAP
jgi:iron complex transport system substrate-binding protein